MTFSNNPINPNVQSVFLLSNDFCFFCFPAFFFLVAQDKTKADERNMRADTQVSALFNNKTYGSTSGTAATGVVREDVTRVQTGLRA